MTDPVRHFSSDYTAARAKFLAAAAFAGFPAESHPHPLKGPAGENLAMDVVAVCPHAGGAAPCEMERVFFVLSGTHGVEAFAGSAAQTGWLTEGHWRETPPGTAVVLLHAVNPHGFAHLRRVTEDNVDLNRNFLDFTQPPPPRPAYDALKTYICPTTWTPDTVAAADKAMADFASQHGQAALNRAVMGGQFTDPAGVFYGGAKPTWSHEKILAVLRAYTKRAARVALIDIHTGLGPFGDGVCYAVGTANDACVTAARRLWGEDAVVLSGSRPMQVHEGYNLAGFARELAPVPFHGVTLEFGTYPLDQVLRALRADNWLYLHGDVNSAQGKAIKAEIKHALYPEDSADWKTRVFARSMDVWRKGLRALAAA